MIADLFTVFQAELARRVKSRAFVIGLVIGMLGIVLFTRLPALVGNAFSGSNAIVLIAPAQIAGRAQSLLTEDYNIHATLPPGTTVSPSLLESNKATAAIVLETKADGLHVSVFAHDPGSTGKRDINHDLLPLQLQLVTHRAPADVTSMMTIPITIKTVASKFASSDQALAARGIAYMLIFFLYILILVNSQLVTSSVAEEKTSRIAELLVASVNPSALLGGKILAGAVIALLQMTVWIGVGVLTGGSSPSSGAAPAAPDANSIFSLSGLFDVITPWTLAAFFLFFVIGFLQLSMVFAAFASLINRTEDLGSITGPLVIPVVAGLFVAIAALGEPDASWAVITSMIPIVAPFIMFARIAVSNVPVWQVGLSLAINFAALYLIAIFAGKIYRVGMLLYGRAPKLSQVWSVIRS
jgi:ABC-2 type transport system permease protein